MRICVILITVLLGGCASSKSRSSVATAAKPIGEDDSIREHVNAAESVRLSTTEQTGEFSPIRLVDFQETEPATSDDSPEVPGPMIADGAADDSTTDDSMIDDETKTDETNSANEPPDEFASELKLSLDTSDSLAQLEAIAIAQNPALQRISREYEAARARIEYVDALPDPMLGGNVFLSPIETAAGSQRANLTLSQRIPSLARLDAQARQACLEAMAIQQVYAAERLKMVASIRSQWYRLYVLQNSIEINKQNQDLLESLIEVANSRVATGKATSGDVLSGTVELGKLEEQILTLRQQRNSATVELNRLLGRNADAKISAPQTIDASLPDSDYQMLRQLSWEHQPDIVAARIRTQATLWGLKIARLKRRPEFSVNASWFGIEGNRPTSSIVDVGQDAWAIGGSVSIPVSRRKYDAIEREADWKHQAAHSSVDVVRQRYDALLRDLWEQAKTASETARLYEDTILPQARDTLEADQESYATGNVEFDRLIRDFRNVITLELGYHQAISRLATARAGIQQAIGNVGM